MGEVAMQVVENINTPGRTSRVNAVKYAAMRALLLAVLPRRAPGVSQAEMVRAVIQRVPQDLWPGGDKAAWWVKTVQLDLEAKGLVRRDRSGKPTRWYRV